jgi:hypothetical protein
MLLAFGVVGMVLSEVFCWNMAPLVEAAGRGPLHVGVAVAAAIAGYTLMFAVVLDLVHRWGVSDWLGVLLAGSIYGLINEGIFGETVFLPGPGPRVLGIWPIRAAFPALSWHPLIDFAFSVLVVGGICRGSAVVAERRVRPGDAIGAVVVGAVLAATSRLPWVRTALGGVDLPLWVQSFAVLFGSLALGCAVLNALRHPADALPLEVLGPRARTVAWSVVGLAALLRALSLPDKLAIFPFVLLVAAHLLVLRFHTSPGRNGRQRSLSILRTCYPVRGRADPVKLAVLAGLAIVSFAIVRGVTSLPVLQVFARPLGLLVVINATVYALLFPIIMTLRAALTRLR